MGKTVRGGTAKDRTEKRKSQMGRRRNADRKKSARSKREEGAFVCYNFSI